jgi:hypothetical protein
MNIRIDRTRVFLVLPLAFIVVCAALAVYLPFDSVVSDAETEVLDFSPAALKIFRKTMIARTIPRESPFDFADVKPFHVNEGPHDIQKSGASVSLIVISGKEKMAIIDGRTVKEGDFVGGLKIARIESDRILLKDRSSRWLYIKKGP